MRTNRSPVKKAVVVTSDPQDGDSGIAFRRQHCRRSFDGVDIFALWL
jgi:hypothetical protein